MLKTNPLQNPVQVRLLSISSLLWFLECALDLCTSRPPFYFVVPWERIGRSISPIGTIWCNKRKSPSKTSTPSLTWSSSLESSRLVSQPFNFLNFPRIQKHYQIPQIWTSQTYLDLQQLPSHQKNWVGVLRRSCQVRCPPLRRKQPWARNRFG